MICELAIDTAGAGCSAALRFGASSDRQTLTRFEDIRRGHAEHIINQVSSLFDEAGISYQSLNRINCTMGPGSFTGVRVGIAYAKGLALSLDVPLFGAVCSDVAAVKFASSYSELSEEFEEDFKVLSLSDAHSFHVCHVLEAGRDEFYVHVFERLSSGSLKPLTKPLLLSYNQVQSFVEQHPIKLSVGPGGELLQKLNQDALDEMALSHGCVSSLPLDIWAEDLFRLDEEQFFVDEEVRPLYLRAPDAKPQVGKTLVRRL
jgi:tRNA threonylcarbamoyl adenosine modification protein YeaZ